MLAVHQPRIQHREYRAHEPARVVVRDAVQPPRDVVDGGPLLEGDQVIGVLFKVFERPLPPDPHELHTVSRVEPLPLKVVHKLDLVAVHAAPRLYQPPGKLRAQEAAIYQRPDVPGVQTAGKRLRVVAEMSLYPVPPGGADIKAAEGLVVAQKVEEQSSGRL